MRFARLICPLLLLCAAGCGRFAAHRLVQAPNSYPRWLAPKAPVSLQFSGKLLTSFTNHYLKVESPPARLRYRLIEPADYQFRWTNYLNEAAEQLELSFAARVDHLAERTRSWSGPRRGTVVLLHGYGVAGFAMLPWAFLLAQDGWRCVLVDLRGHGKSTGSRIYFGVQETRDLAALLDQLHREESVNYPVAVVGHSFGAVLALRWKMLDPRVDKVVAMCPYAELPRAVLNISQQYAPWLPKSFLRAGLRRLPGLLQVKPGELNPACWMQEHPETALFIAGGADKIAPPDQVSRLFAAATPESELLIVPSAAHEPLPYYFDGLALPITSWLSAGSRRDHARPNNPY